MRTKLNWLILTLLFSIDGHCEKASENLTFQEYLQQGRLQEASWIADEIGDKETARNLEDEIKNVLLSQPIRYSKNSDQGHSTAYLYEFDQGIKAIVKADAPSALKPQSWDPLYVLSPLFYLIGNSYRKSASARQEVLAYQLSSSLRLNVVPTTVVAKENYMDYSRQYFVPNAKTGGKFRLELFNRIAENPDLISEDFYIEVPRRSPAKKSTKPGFYSLNAYTLYYSRGSFGFNYKTTEEQTNIYFLSKNKEDKEDGGFFSRLKNSARLPREHVPLDEAEFAFVFGQAFMHSDTDLPHYIAAPRTTHIGEMLILDYLIGHLDRFEDNWLVLQDDYQSRLVAIDHGHSEHAFNPELAFMSFDTKKCRFSAYEERMNFGFKYPLSNLPDRVKDSISAMSIESFEELIANSPRNVSGPMVEKFKVIKRCLEADN